MIRRLLAALLLVPSLGWAATAYQTLVSASSPCTYWYMDATSGTTETNHGSATNQNATYVNTPTLNQTGILGNPGSPAVTFASASSQKMTWPGTGGNACPITTTSIPTCNSGTPVNATVIAWVNPSNLSTDRVVVSSAGATHYTFQLVLGGGAATGKIYATMWQDPGSTYLQPIGTQLVCSVGNWCMAGMKFTASGTTLRVYANGSPDTSANTPSGTCGGQQASGLPSVGGRGDGSIYMSGTIDEVAWFDQALSDATILGFYTAGATVPATGGLGAYSVKAPADQFPMHPRAEFIRDFIRDPAYQMGGMRMRSASLFGAPAPIAFGPQFPLRTYLGR